MFQYTLISISAVLYTFSLSYLIRFVFIYKQFDKFFFITFMSFGAGFYSVFQYMLSQELTIPDVLFYHRLKLLSAMISIPCWYIIMYDIYKIKSRLPKYYIILTCVLLLSIPSNYFLNEPVRYLSKDLFGVEFIYQFGKTGISYSIWAVATLFMMLYSPIRIFKSKANFLFKLSGTAIFLIAAASSINDFLNSHDLIHSIMSAEYVFPICVAFVIAYFLNEEGLNHKSLKNMSEIIVEQRDLAEKRLEITQAYTRKSIVDKIRSRMDPRDIKPEMKESSILFADIRNFTSFTENSDAIDVVNFLNLYFNQMNTSIVRRNGEIDKLIGDGLMAVFMKADDAMKASFEMRNVLPKLRASLGEDFNIGMGISWGEVIIGNLGSESKMDYTVIGDIVNVASRLEKLTKRYNADIIITDQFYSQLEGDYIIRPLDKVRLRGKTESTIIYEACDHLIGNNKSVKIEHKENFEKAFNLYLEGKFKEAKIIFDFINGALKMKHQEEYDIIPKIFSDRCVLLMELESQGQLENWDGVYIVKED